MTVVVESPSLMMTVQDRGRWGYQRYGLPESGPMDWWAFRAANALVGNVADCACLEMGFSNAILKVEADAIMALAGAGYRLNVNHRQVPLWMVFRVKPGDFIHIEKNHGGNWVYLAVSGGFLSPVWLGSRSTYARAGLGRLIISGDRLPISAKAGQKQWFAGRAFPQSARPLYDQPPHLRVVLGPHQACFNEKDIQAFLNAGYDLTPQSDRMGYRLSGPIIHHRTHADLVSQGMAMGEIQVPADGQPIVMMPDHPTTGGYACIGTVARVDLPLLAQAQPGEAEIRFHAVGVDEGQDALRKADDRLATALQSQEEPWQGL